MSDEMPIRDETVDLELLEPPVVTVVMDDMVKTSDDFVAILCDKEGKIGIFYNTDAVTLGIAVKMIAVEYIKLLSGSSLEDQEAVTSILGEAFSLASIMADEETDKAA